MPATLTAPRAEQVSRAAVRVGLLLGAAVALALLHAAHRPALPCLFRALTGLPCPLCGSTTAAVQIGSGHPGAAIAASPLAVFGAATFALWPLASGAVVTTTGRFRNQLVLSLLAASELWQLNRLLLH